MRNKMSSKYDPWRQDERTVDIRNEMHQAFSSKSEWQSWLNTPAGTARVLEHSAWAEWWEDAVERITRELFP
jgi:hypothetical protein